ncbi:MAG: hypothetical protein KY464_17575, partial [Gemmatimonadetes bacterium]|nr:hypothetical protein [Gemmatimonadota bacterium]
GVVLGGDLTRSPGPVVIDVTVVGEAKRPVLRSGAQPGDEVWVTGELGGAGVTVARLLRGELPNPDALPCYTSPIPRVAEALWLAEHAGPTAMLDLSDGLAGDAAHLAAASRAAIVLERETIPIHPAVSADTSSPVDALAYAISGGEDYELCFCAPAGSVQPLLDGFEGEFGIRITRVGLVEAGEGVFWACADGTRELVHRGGYQHFEPGG